VDLSPRKLRYFVAVADELHFGRAATRLYIAQQSLSAQIRELEDQVGVQLLRRSTRKVELTAAGAVFLAAAKSALAALDQAVEDARRAARGEVGALKVGFMIGAAIELTRPILAEFRDRFPGIMLELREYNFSDTSAGLTDGWADVAFIRPPISAAGIEFETLFVEPRVVALALGHPLAARKTLRIDEILQLPIAVGESPDLAWQEFWSLAEYRAGSQRPRMIPTRSQTEENEIVASGDACSVTVASVIRITPNPGVCHRTVTGLSGSAAALAWHRDRRGTMVDNLIAVAAEVRDRERALVHQIEHPFD
jgi:DNA-binding transcriptional LysR family regulator